MNRQRFTRGLCLTLFMIVLWALPAQAYVGPGAGMVVASSAITVFATIAFAIGAILLWPLRALIRWRKRSKADKPWVKRLIIVGFDGQDPRVTDKLMAEGKLPNMSKLAERGCYHRLGTTYPSITPVAWSSFATGVNPGRHNIFDFLDRDTRTYLPKLSSAHIGGVDRFFKIGKWQFPLAKPVLRLLRRSQTFWAVLGEHSIWSTILRVPISFPPSKFYGAELSAMSIPDLLGTQGTFLLLTTRDASDGFKEGGMRVDMEKQGPNSYKAVIEGPENSFLIKATPMTVEVSLEIDDAKARGTVKLGDETVDVGLMELSDWVNIKFKASLGVEVSGITRMMLTEIGDHVSLYMTPLNLDPEAPAMPISHPSYFSTYLSKKIGPFATLGLAEDTWALNEDITDDHTFWQQTVDISAERERMLFSQLEKVREGAVVCVFDASDRVQHMYWRYTEDGHPADDGRDSPHRNAIEKMYVDNDAIVGRLLDELNEDDVLFVISDHGFTSFRRGVNLNAWLKANGYLTLKEGTDGSSEWLRDVDWSKTRAYSVGLSGMYLNIKGRESQGIVNPGADVQALKAELIEKMSGMIDPEHDAVAINEVFDTAKLYSGPYAANAQDLIVGYNHGYRISWDGATGVTHDEVFDDNTKAWSGDHCVDPRLVPGVLFSTHAIDAENPHLIDLAPTALKMFGITPPAYMEGKSLYESAASLGGKA